MCKEYSTRLTTANIAESSFQQFQIIFRRSKNSLNLFVLLVVRCVEFRHHDTYPAWGACLKSYPPYKGNAFLPNGPSQANKLTSSRYFPKWRIRLNLFLQHRNNVKIEEICWTIKNWYFCTHSGQPYFQQFTLRVQLSNQHSYWEYPLLKFPQSYIPNFST